jgi:2,3-bisphosphoglycerate-independent phosphoglycerate mutase
MWWQRTTFASGPEADLTNMETRPLVLMILDGWGHREPASDNAITLANTPAWDQLLATSQLALLDTSGKSVGLPDGQMGNSEVGHMNIGAGRIVYQDFTRISHAIETGEFTANPAICAGIAAAREAGGAVHIMGLLSPGGVHSHEEHFLATVQLASGLGAEQIFVHAFLDGRDTPPRSAEPSVLAMQTLLEQTPGGVFGTLAGRYYAMDRDQRWDRVEQAWNALVDARAGYRSENALAGLNAAYGRGESDEFVKPTLIGDYPGVKDGDCVVFVNFRADRAREITRAFVQPDFDGFDRHAPSLAAFVAMTEYQAGLPVEVAFPPEQLHDIMGEVVARQGLRQLRIAETEKYAHVTFFLNGGREVPFDNEDRILVPSPRVATYDLQPQMSEPELAEKLDTAIREGGYDVIFCNVANPDMVGHTGKLDAAILAVEAVDHCLGVVCGALEAVGGELLVTADHGNVEQMSDSDSGQSHTAHTTNPVPLVFHGRKASMFHHGSLRDIAPTMLTLLGLQVPESMTGQSLVQLEDEQSSVA